MLTTPLDGIFDLQFKENLIITRENLKKEILLEYSKNVVYRKNLSLDELANFFVAKLGGKYEAFLKGIDKDKKIDGVFCEICFVLFKKLLLKKKTELTGDEIFFWVPKDGVFKGPKNGTLNKAKNRVRLWVILTKIYLKLKDLIIKRDKILDGNKTIKDHSIGIKLGDYEKSRKRYDDEKNKLKKKKEKLEIKKKMLEESKKKIKSPKTPPRKKNKKDKNEKNTPPNSTKSKNKKDNNKKNLIHNFFQIKKNENNVQIKYQKDYSRWKSSGAFKFTRNNINQKKDLIVNFIDNLYPENKLSKSTKNSISNYKENSEKKPNEEIITKETIRNFLNSKDSPKKSDTEKTKQNKKLQKPLKKTPSTTPQTLPSLKALKSDYQKTQKAKPVKTSIKHSTAFRFVRFEDYKKDFKEYKGLFIDTTQKKRNPLNQLQKNLELFTYDIYTEDEIQCAYADSIKENDNDEDDNLDNEELDSFIVGDEYLSEDFSEEEECGPGLTKLRRVSKNKNDKFSIFYDFKEDLNEELEFLELKDKFTIINLTLDQFPLPFEKILDDKNVVLNDKVTPVMTEDDFSKILLKIIGLPTKKAILQVLNDENIEFSRKDIYNKIKENGKIVHYVNPRDFRDYSIHRKYFDVMDKNLKGEKIDKKKIGNFMERLCLIIHGCSNSSDYKEKHVFRALREYYEHVSKNHIEKNIKNLTRVGYMFQKNFLHNLGISQNKILSVIESRFTNEF